MHPGWDASAFQHAVHTHTRTITALYVLGKEETGEPRGKPHGQ